MSVTPLDYAQRPEFDTGRFVARYLQVLAWVSIAWMVAAPIFFDSLHIDLSPIFHFWAASALKRRSRAARKWVLGVAAFLLGVLVLLVVLALFTGTEGMHISYGVGRIEDPAVWQVVAVAVAIAAVVCVPFVVLMSDRARRQFGGVSASRTSGERRIG